MSEKSAKFAKLYGASDEIAKEVAAAALLPGPTPDRSQVEQAEARVAEVLRQHRPATQQDVHELSESLHAIEESIGDTIHNAIQKLIDSDTISESIDDDHISQVIKDLLEDKELTDLIAEESLENTVETILDNSKVFDRLEKIDEVAESANKEAQELNGSVDELCGVVFQRGFFGRLWWLLTGK